MKQPRTYQGYHRTWHVHGRYKLGEPREEALWFDRRCFESEEDLLADLAGLRTPRIPAVRRIDGSELRLQDFIRGHSLAEKAPMGTAVSSWYVRQIMARFRQLATVRPGDIRTSRRCELQDRTEDGDSAGFLTTLIGFTHQHAYLNRRQEYGELFAQLHVPDGALGPGSWLAGEAQALTPRPYCLLHGDLHRANFIVDRWRRLWTIDWELAMLGDPVYDLATHLHLMGYPQAQERQIVALWRETVPAVLPGADAGLDDDLPRYLAYKRAQSVFTDVVRHAQGPPGAGTAATIHGVLVRAADVLGVTEVPGHEDIALAYKQHTTAPLA